MKSQAGRVVVGFDGSDHSAAALEWATHEAQRRGRPLTVLHIIDYLGMIPSPMGPFGWPNVHDPSVARTAKTGADRARVLAEDLEVDAITWVASVASTLIEVSAEADLVVVGTRGHGDLAGTVLGSVAFAVSAHARCPVAVVRGEPRRPGPDQPVLVGVDGSAGSDEAVRYAADLAAAAHAPLVVISAFRTLASQTWAEAAYYDLESGGGPTFDTIARETARSVAAAAARIARTAYPELDIAERAVEGLPARVLTRAGAAAGILVAGSRGHGGFVGLVLGSVGHALIHSAPCPVMIVHPPIGSTQPTEEAASVQREPVFAGLTAPAAPPAASRPGRDPGGFAAGAPTDSSTSTSTSIGRAE